MRRFSSYLSRGLRNLAKARFRFSSAHPNFRGEFFFAGDHDKAESQPITKKYFFRPSSRTGTVSATITTEYSLQPDAEFPNPFADYLADDAKVWTMYLNLTKNKGEELMRMWNSDLDTILIFAGLFSAILTAFLIETRKSLQPDSQVTANLLLEQVIQQLRNPGSPYNSSVTLQNNFNPPNPLLWVNGLWFVSLTFSLAGAFGAILAKGWVSQFIPTSAGLPIDDACNRHRRFFGDDQRHLRAIITTIPITLHIGFFLFFAGLIVLLFQDDVRIGIVVTVFISITIILYLGCSMRPVLNPNSPFRTPISGLLPVLPIISLPIILLCDAMGHLWFSPHRRHYKSKHVIQMGAFTGSEALCLSITETRKRWMGGITQTLNALHRLMLVSNPPSDELRTDVLVGLFSLARLGYNLDEPVYALAGLPSTPRLQEALYNADPLPVLMRNLTEVFSNPTKLETPDAAQAYLIVLLSLVQTTHSSLNWTATTLMPLLEPGGILSSWETFHGDILELVVCIQIHAHVRSGYILPSNLMDIIPRIITKSTNPLHQCLLIEACLTLSVIDKGAILEQLVLDDVCRQLLLDLNLSEILSNMMNHPQKRVQKAALTSILAICMHESSCIALLERNIFNLLLEYIPGRDSQLQSQALGIFPAFIEYGKAQSSDVNSLGDTTYDPSILVPWIEDIFGLFLAAMVKSQQLNVQEATISALSSYLQYDYTRAEFLRLDHLTVLLQMLEINDNSDLQLAAIAVLKVLLSHNDAQEALDQKQFSHTLAWTLKTCTYHTKKNVLEFFLYCLTFANDDLKETLLQEFIDTLTELFTTENTVSELMEKIFMVFYVISTHETTCKILLSSDSILHLLNTVKKPESYTPISIDLSQRTLINVLKNKHKLPTFSGRVLDDARKPFICQGFVYTIAELLEDGDPALQLFSMDLLFHCLTYYDLRQLLYNSKVILILGHKLSCGGFHVQKATLNILLILIGYEDLRSAVIRSTIVAPLLDIVRKDWSQLSDPSLKLLTICMKQSRYPVSLLPDNALDILADLLQSSNNHALLAAITIIMECTQLVHFKHNNSILDFVSLHVVKQITNIFSSTTQLVLQDKAAEALHHFANNDHLRLMLATNEFYSSIFQALMSSDPSFQSSALEILLVLSKFNETSLLLSKESYITVLMDLLAICDVNMQVLILKIITNLTHFKNIHGILLLHNIFDNLYIFGMYPDIELAKTVMELFEKLVIYDNFRYKMDVIAFMRMTLHLLHSRNLQLQQIACHTFSCLIVHNDIHNKIICPDIVILIYGELHQNFGPLEPPQSLTSNERLYLLKLLNIMQEASPSAVQDLIQEFFPPISPSNLYITFQHAALDFPSDQNSYQSENSYSTHQDSDSEILHINSV